MMAANLEAVMAAAAVTRDRAAAERLARTRAGMREIGNRRELEPPRGGQLTPLASLLTVAYGASGVVRSAPIGAAGASDRDTAADRLEQLERQLGALLYAAAPTTWQSHRRTLNRVLRQARREIRGRDRSSPMQES